jgi:hypothetical protein
MSMSRDFVVHSIPSSVHLLVTKIKHIQDAALHDLAAIAHPVLVFLKALNGCLVRLDQQRMMDCERNKTETKDQCDNDDKDPLRIKLALTLEHR